MRKIAFLVFFLSLFYCAFYADVFANSKGEKTGELSESEILKKHFLEKYQFFLLPEEKKELKKLQNEAEIKKFIADFWKARDPDPNSLENEFKDEIDKRIVEIQNEMLFSAETPVYFKDNGGLKGDMAHVYLYYGMPTEKKFVSGSTFVDLLLWLYIDEKGKELYRFLFYKRNNSGIFVLFRNQGNLVQALKEISVHWWGGAPIGTIEEYQEAEEVLNELQMKGGGEFVRALTEFSEYADVHLDEALAPPRPAVAAKNNIKVEGLPLSPKEEEKIMRSSHAASIPAEIEIEKDSVVIQIKAVDVDWVVTTNGEGLRCELLIQIRTGKSIVEQEVEAKEKSLSTEATIKIKIPVTVPIDYIYVKNKVTKKYNVIFPLK